MEELKFNAFLEADLKKSVDVETDEKNYYFSGYASTPSRDRQGEVINPKGMSLEIFKSDGYVNYEHQKDKLIGIPTDNCYLDPDKGLFIEVQLFKGNKYAEEMVELAQNLEKSGTDRKIGFSIEGMVKKRNAQDNTIIDEMVVTGVALTKVPANSQARAEFVLKSFLTGTGTTPDTQVDAGALRRESLATSITNLTYVTKIKDLKEYNNTWNQVVEYLEKNNQMGYEESVVTLQLAKGLSRKDAELAVMNINTKKLED